MPGVIEVPQTLQIGEAIEELVLMAECSLENEWNNRMIFIPLLEGSSPVKTLSVNYLPDNGTPKILIRATGPTWCLVVK